MRNVRVQDLICSISQPRQLRGPITEKNIINVIAQIPWQEDFINSNQPLRDFFSGDLRIGVLTNGQAVNAGYPFQR